MSSSKINKHDVELTASDVGAISLGIPVAEIPSGADLNDYTTVGEYRTPTASVSATILNAPYKQSGFKLIVEKGSTDTHFIQTIKTPNNAYVYTRGIIESGGTYYYRPWKCVDDYLPLTGGKLSGGLTLEDGIINVSYGANGAYFIHFPNPSDTTLLQMLAVDGSKTLPQSVKTMRRENNKDTLYNIYGEHNKPNGSYVGNGSATKREINIGGLGEALVINGNIYTTFIGIYGGFSINGTTGAVTGFSQNNLKFFNGILTVAETNEAINKNGSKYWYYTL